MPVKAGVQWDTQAYDWEELSKRADQIRLLPEPDPSAYYQRMTEVLSFLKGKADLRRVALVISRQSYSKGSDGVQTLSLRDALQLASSIEVRTNTPIAPNSSVVVVGKNIFQDDGASGVRWDETASAVSFTYPGRGGPRTVWLENTLSVAFKLDLARRFNLGGVVIDDITQDSGAPQVWELLRGFSETGNVQLVAPQRRLPATDLEGAGRQQRARRQGQRRLEGPGPARRLRRLADRQRRRHPGRAEGHS